jgi:hypothetical protein
MNREQGDKIRARVARANGITTAQLGVLEMATWREDGRVFDYGTRDSTIAALVMTKHVAEEPLVVDLERRNTVSYEIWEHADKACHLLKETLNNWPLASAELNAAEKLQATLSQRVFRITPKGRELVTELKKALSVEDTAEQESN